jgi:hypothetical protein
MRSSTKKMLIRLPNNPIWRKSKKANENVVLCISNLWQKLVIVTVQFIAVKPERH